jgi:hypothetical protein
VELAELQEEVCPISFNRGQVRGAGPSVYNGPSTRLALFMLGGEVATRCLFSGCSSVVDGSKRLSHSVVVHSSSGGQLHNAVRDNRCWANFDFIEHRGIIIVCFLVDLLYREVYPCSATNGYNFQFLRVASLTVSLIGPNT